MNDTGQVPKRLKKVEVARDVSSAMKLSDRSTLTVA